MENSRRKFLKKTGIGLVTFFGLREARANNLEVYLSKRITRTNDPQKADILNVAPVQIGLIGKTKISGIKITTTDEREVIYGIVKQGAQLYFIENPSKRVIERNSTIVLQPFKSQIISLDGFKSYWDTDVPIEVTSGKIVTPVEITSIQAKVNRTDYKLPFFLINSRAYCIARTEAGVYHLVENPYDNVTLKGNTLTIDSKTSFRLGNLENRVN